MIFRCHESKEVSEGIFIFAAKGIRKRIKGSARHTETIKHRLSCVDRELACIINYQYVVVNGEVDTAAEQIRAIISAEKCRVDRMACLNQKGGNIFD